MGELFNVDVKTINEHLKNIFADSELTEEATIRKFRLHIKCSSLYTPEKGLFTDTVKNTSSERSIKLPSAAIKMLKEYKV